MAFQDLAMAISDQKQEAVTRSRSVFNVAAETEVIVMDVKYLVAHDPVVSLLQPLVNKRICLASTALLLPFAQK